MAEEPKVEEPKDGESEGSRLGTAVAILIAIVTVIGALVAWRASLADDASGDADYAGLRAAANYEDARANSRVNAYEDYSVYISYFRYKELSDGLDKLAANAQGERKTELQKQAREMADLATANLNLLDELDAARNLKRNGKYNLQRDVGVRMAAAAKKENLDFAGQFKEAEDYRVKSLRLLKAVVVLSLSLVAFTLVESFEGALAYALVGVGVLTMLSGTIYAILVEMGKIA